MRSFVTRQDDKQRNRRPDKIWPPWEAENFKLSPSRSELEGMRDGQTWKKTALVRFLHPGESGPYRYRQCFAGGKYHISTKDVEGFDGKDVINHYWSLSEYGEDDNRNFSQKLQYALELVDFRYFHSEVIDGRMVYHTCSSYSANPDSRRCDKCADGMDRLFGGHKAWSMTKHRYEQLMDVHDDLQNICINDDDEVFGKEIFPGTVGFNCYNCDFEMVGEKDIQIMSSRDKEAFYCSEHQCPECGHKGFAKEIALIERSPGGETVEAERGSMFDKMIKITATGEKITGKDGKPRTNPRSVNYSFSHEGQDFSNVEQDLVDLGFSEDAIDEFMEPMDLAYHYRPEMLNPEKFDSKEAYVQEVLDRQAAAIGRENPYKNDVPPSTGGRKSVPWRRS
jgi:hypothetical protein